MVKQLKAKNGLHPLRQADIEHTPALSYSCVRHGLYLQARVKKEITEGHICISVHTTSKSLLHAVASQIHEACEERKGVGGGKGWW